MPANRGLSAEQKETVDDIFASGIQRPKLVLSELRRRGIPEPMMTRLKVYLTALRQKKCGPPKATFGELYQWCIDRSEVPDDMDTPFVQQVFDDSSDVPKIRILFTTKRLISLTSQATNIHADATYKLNWNGYPVLVAGCTDRSGRFHPYSLAITTAETEDDFAFIFSTIKNLASQLANHQFNPSVLVADCADSITNGFTSAFRSDFVRVHCWAHIHRNVQKQLLVIKSEELRSRFSSDIDMLQLAHTAESFEKASVLFVDKWEAIGEASAAPLNQQILQCLHHVVAEYFQKHPGWFEGHAPGHPSHNNALESTNNVIKTEYTMRSRLPVSQFATMACTIVQDWSHSRNPETVNSIPFHTEVPIETKHYEEAYAFMREKRKMLTQRTAEFITTYITAKGLTDITADQVRQYKRHFDENDWPSFDDYEKMRMLMWVVRVPLRNWKDGTCSCPRFTKKSMCKHLIAVAATFDLTAIPNNAKSIVLGQKKKRGRPAKATRALVRD